MAPRPHTTPPPPPTGFALDGCYAAPLSDCSKKLSKEHYISRNLLESIGAIADVSGLSFLSEEKRIASAALQATVLCDRHNECLGPLDSAAGEFFRALREFDAGFATTVSEPTAETRTISGDALESWCLKVVAGMVHAGVVGAAGLRPQLDYLGILFGGKTWPPKWGLSFGLTADDEPPRFAFNGLGINTHVVGDELWGAEFNIAGVNLCLHFGAPGGRELSYRPEGIRFRRETSAAKTIHLAWAGRARSEFVYAFRVGDYTGERPFPQ